MRQKRARASTEDRVTLRKRARKSYTEPSTQSLFGDEDSSSQPWYSVESILDERRLPGKAIEYLCAWSPNPDSGETYQPSWEPADNLTAPLLEEWRARKARKSGDKAEGASTAPSNPTSRRSSRSTATVEDNDVLKSPVGGQSLKTQFAKAKAAGQHDRGRPHSSGFGSPRLASLAHSSRARTSSGSPQPDTAVNDSDTRQHNGYSPEVHPTQRLDFPRNDYVDATRFVSQTESHVSPISPRSPTLRSALPASGRLEIPDSQSQDLDDTHRTESEQAQFATSSPHFELTSPILGAEPTLVDTALQSPEAVLETDPVDATSPYSTRSKRSTRSAVQSPTSPTVPHGEQFPTQGSTQRSQRTSQDDPQPAIGPSSLRSASKTPIQSIKNSIQSPRPSPLRLSRVVSPAGQDLLVIDRQALSNDTRTISPTHEEPPQLSSPSLSAVLRYQPQSTRPQEFQSKDSVSSPVPVAPSQAPDTLLSHLPPQIEVSSMAGTRRSMRSSGANSTNAASAVASQTTRVGRTSRARNTAATQKKALTSNPQTEDEARDDGLSELEPLDDDEKVETGVQSSTPSVIDGDNQSQILEAEARDPEPVMDHDADGNSRLAARIPGDADDDSVDPERRSPPEIRLQQPPKTSATGSSTGSESEDDLGPSLGQMEFIVPLPFAGQARDQYRKTVKYNEELIERFVGRKWSDPVAMLAEAQDFIRTMRNITTHIDLTNETTVTQSDVEPSDVIEWDRSVSTKFKLLFHLLETLRQREMHVILVTQPGRALDILANFLTGMAITFHRGLESTEVSDTSKESFAVTILSSDTTKLSSSDASESTSTKLPQATAVVTLDRLPDEFKLILHEARQDTSNTDRLAPLISLAVLNSIDHVDHSIAPMFNPTQRMRILVNCLTKLRKEAGRDDIGLPSIEESAKDIAQFILDKGSDEHWPLPSIGMLNNNDAWDLSQGLVSMKSATSSDSEKSAQAKAAAAKKIQKRPLEDALDERTETSKKMRYTPQPDQDAQDAQEVSVTRVTDSTAVDSFETQKTLAHELNAMTELLKATEEQLKISSETAGKRIGGLESDLSDLQFRFEEQTAEKRQLAKDLAEARQRLDIAMKQKEARDVTIEKLKEETRELKSNLSDAHGALSGSQIPEIAAMEQLRQAKEHAEIAQRKAEKNAAMQEQMMGYIREQLDEARSRASDLQEQNRFYEQRVSKLEQQATGELSKARQLFLDERAKNESAENVRLKQENRNLQQLIQRKEDELKSRRSGMGTRAGSVPRSPRVGPASRAGSPIPDRRIGALKNNMMPGRRQPKTPKQTQSQGEDALDSPKSASGAAPVIAEPKPRGRPVELKALEAKHADGKGSDPKSADNPASTPRSSDVRSSANNSRPFPCVFAQYNCGSAFTSKNEWKRHISTKHIQLGFWRCDMCPPSPGIDHPVYNDFNRKDLFTQHLRRMHAVQAPQTLGEPPAPMPSPGGGPPNLTDEQITEIQKRCYRQLRAPPDISSCVFCPRTFSGLNSWEERLEHVGGHLERDRKNGTTCSDVTLWRPDPQLRDYLVTEGLVEVDVRGGYRIGDGKPRRPLDIEGFAGQAPTAQLTPRANVNQDGSASSPAGGKDGEIDDSEGSSGRRRRGRPPKRSIESLDADAPAPAQALVPSTAPPTTQATQSPSLKQEPGVSMPVPDKGSAGPSANSSAPLLGPGPGPPVHQHGQLPPHLIPVPPSHVHPQMHPNQPPPGTLIPHQHQGQTGQPDGIPLGHGPHYPGQPQHVIQHPRDPREGGLQPYPGPPGGPPMSPRQFHLPPSNLQNMYKFEHGSFTKFPGNNPQWPQMARPLEFGPPGGQVGPRTPGQPQLAPKPAPSYADEVLSRIWANAPQLAPKPLMQPGELGRDGIPPRPSSQGGLPPQFQGGFRPINDARRADGPIPVAPKPSSQPIQEGPGRQLAPKPPVSASSQPMPQYPPHMLQHPPQQPPSGPQHQPYSYPPPTQHEPAQQQPRTPGPVQPQPQPPSAPTQQGPGPQLAPAPTPTPTSAPTPSTPQQPPSQPSPQSPVRPSTPPKQTGGGAEMEEAQKSARGRSFRDIVMS